MHTIKFRDGSRMDWNSYRAMMLGQISPFRAVAASRPELALDAAPRWLSRDQKNGGRLDGAYVRATTSYLRNSGLPAEDVYAVTKDPRPMWCP